MKNYQLGFASDFDNTLYFRTGFRQSDFLAIKEKQKQGLLFGVCTGRSLSGVIKPTNGQIEYDFYIVATGSLILDRDRNVLFSKIIEKEFVDKITQEYGHKYKIAYNVGSDFYSLHHDYEVVKTISSLNELPKTVHGISFLTESSDIADKICISLNSKYQVSAFHNGPFVDITALGCSKGKALRFLKEHYHLDKIAAMGDSYNDITMLKDSDVSFTFPSSPEEVKQIATYIQPSVKDAITLFVEKYSRT